MAYKIPWSNFHELNLDWLLQQVKTLREDVDGLIGSSTPSNTTPEMDGFGTPGTSVSYSRGDHRHPTDTSRASASDLTQEITDRGNADITLQTNIDAVDAKIKFSSAAPIMDSTSASAGFSDYMARADHIHPTDTSRASATDLAVLQARVDGFTGSALPSDLTPNMDGVGSAGSGGNYSRGDHVHPSDTSKLDKAGGTITGDLTVKGDLYPAKSHATASPDAIGWLRVAAVPIVGGTFVRFNIQRKGNLSPAESHEIVLAINDSPDFIEEISVSATQIIDKIRLSSVGFVDVHLDQNYASTLMVDVAGHASTKSAMDAIHAVTVSAVADAPVGETILAVYDFADNTTGALPSITNQKTGISVAGTQYRNGKVVYYDLSIGLAEGYSSVTINASDLLATGFMPPATDNLYPVFVDWVGTVSPLRCNIDNTGSLRAFWDSATITISGQLRALIAYITK